MFSVSLKQKINYKTLNSISTMVCENSPIIGQQSMVFGVILSTVILIFAMPITNRGPIVCTKPYHNSSRTKWLNKSLQWAHQGKQQARLLLACISSTSMIFTVDSRKGGVRIPQITILIIFGDPLLIRYVHISCYKHDTRIFGWRFGGGFAVRMRSKPST